MPDNWVKTSLIDRGYGLHEVDGYTVQDNKVTALIDYIPSSMMAQADVSTVKDIRGADAIDAKIRLAEELDCPYYVVRYNGQVELFKFTDERLEHDSTFKDVSEFGQWTMTIRDRAIKKYTRDTSSWSSLEQELINNDVGAPGDLDSFYYERGNVQAIIEWQTTNKDSPAEHSNNDWFSDDIGRWKPLWTISRQINAPLIILVWSPKSKYDGVRIKRVSDISFQGANMGLEYSVDRNIPDARSSHDTIASELSNIAQYQ